MGYQIAWLEKPLGAVQFTPLLGLEPLVIPNISTSYRVLLSDGCSTPDDSAEVFVHVRNPLQAGILRSGNMANPQQACYGEAVILRGTATGGDSSRYTFIWKKEGDANEILGDSLMLTATESQTWRVMLRDACSQPEADTAFFSFTVPQPLALQVNEDTTICEGQAVRFTAVISGGNPLNYRITWSGPGLSAADSLFSFSFKPAESGWYRGKSADGCALDTAAVDSFFINVLPKPTAAFSLNTAAGCPPLLLSPADNSLNHNRALNFWRLTSNNFSQTRQEAVPGFSLTAAGTYSLFLRVSNDLGCTDSLSLPASVVVHPKPVADFVVRPDVKVIESPVFFTNTSTGAERYQWLIGSESLETPSKQDIQRSYTDTGTFSVRLVAINRFNCTDTAEQQVEIRDPFTYIMPNAFSPNRDGLNERFAPVITGTEAYHLSIYNRWGELIFDCACSGGCEGGQTCGWDGTFKGTPVQDGLYTYLIRFTSIQKRKKTAWGTVVVVR